jgi:hypothetical protein
MLDINLLQRLIDQYVFKSPISLTQAAHVQYLIVLNKMNSIQLQVQTLWKVGHPVSLAQFPVLELRSISASASSTFLNAPHTNIFS